MRPEHFLTRVSDLYWGLSLARGHGRNDFQRNHFALAAESAAHQRLDHTNLRHWHFKHERQLVLQVVRNLGRRPHGQPSGLAGVGIDFEGRQRRVRFHCGMRHFVGDEPCLGYFIGFGKALLRITEDVVIIFLQIPWLGIVDEVGLRLH